MVALCRSVGINARMVAGYLAAEFDASTGRYIVRESNAHAWVEAELGTDRWRRYDPTPPATLCGCTSRRSGSSEGCSGPGIH
jgi:transglutaminase-like putative cysteine protease